MLQNIHNIYLYNNINLHFKVVVGALTAGSIMFLVKLQQNGFLGDCHQLNLKLSLLLKVPAMCQVNLFTLHPTGISLPV